MELNRSLLNPECIGHHRLLFLGNDLELQIGGGQSSKKSSLRQFLLVQPHLVKNKPGRGSLSQATTPWFAATLQKMQSER